MTAAKRGERLADGGFDPLDVRHPDPASIARCHAEWPGTSADSAVSGRLTQSDARSTDLGSTSERASRADRTAHER